MTPKYRADIDGLRAVAVLSVLIFHAGGSFFSGGYVGVDIFFVISGYLITTIIVREIANHEFSIAKFYERRFRRILPALVVVVFASLVAGTILLGPNDRIDLGQSAIATALFSSNILFYFESGYFDGPAELKPLLHTWSLAVEEQYYIFFPLLLVLIARVDSRHYFRWLIILGSISLVACVIGTNIDASGAFYLIPTRAWELFVGSIIALNVLPVPKSRQIRELLSLSGAALIAVGVFLFTRETTFPGIAAAVPTAGTALIIYAGIGGKSFVSNILSHRPIVFIGLISYSLYLWHWPVLVYTKHYFITGMGLLGTGLMMAVIFSLSILSWRYVETPFRKKQLLASRRNLFAISSAVSLAILCGGILLIASQGVRFDLKSIVSGTLRSTDSEWEHWETCEKVTNRINHNQELCDIGMPDAKLGFLFWGDSHARALASGVDLSARMQGIRGKIATEPACPPLVSIERPNRTSCHEYNQAVLRLISNTPEIKTVVLAARWALSTTGTRYKHETGGRVRLVDVQTPNDLSLPNPALFEIGLERTVDKLLSLGKTVILVGPVPEIGYHVPAVYSVSKITGQDINTLISPTREEFNERTKEVTAAFAKIMENRKVLIVKPALYLCNKERCKVADQGVLLYRDSDHLSTHGSKSVAKAFDVIFKEIATDIQ